jgi:hypothetical protein
MRPAGTSIYGKIRESAASIFSSGTELSNFTLFIHIHGDLGPGKHIVPEPADLVTANVRDGANLDLRRAHKGAALTSFVIVSLALCLFRPDVRCRSETGLLLYVSLMFGKRQGNRSVQWLSLLVP